MPEVQLPPMILATVDRVLRTRRSGADQNLLGSAVIQTRRPKAGTGQVVTEAQQVWTYEWDRASQRQLDQILESYHRLPHTPFWLLRETTDNPFSPAWQNTAPVVVFASPPRWQPVEGGQHFQVTVELAPAPGQ